MEINENVSADVIASSNHDEDCYFCNSNEKPDAIENEFADSTAEDDDLDGSIAYGKFKNDAGKLATALGGKPGDKTISVSGESYPVSVAAHHLIPGNASLKNSQLFLSDKYLWKDGKVNGNIGYNVNALTNGVWLPGNYAVRPWSPLPEAFQLTYAWTGIQAWNAQFHDAHEAYSNFVIKILDTIFDKLEMTEDAAWCPEAKKKEDAKPDERSPLYPLVGRLNTVSSRMRRMLVAPSSAWKKNVWTSRFSLLYMSTPATPYLVSK